MCVWVHLMLFFEWHDLRLVQWKVGYREGNKGLPKRKFNLLNLLNLSSQLGQSYHVKDIMDHLNNLAAC